VGIDYSAIATFGTPVSEEVMERLAGEACPEGCPVQDFAVDLPYEFNDYFGLDCDVYGSAMDGEVQYIVGHSAFNHSIRGYGASYKVVELEVEEDKMKKISEFAQKYSLDEPRWYAGMLVS